MVYKKKSVELTAETLIISVVRCTDFDLKDTGYPALNCWAIFNRPLRGLLNLGPWTLYLEPHLTLDFGRWTEVNVGPWTLIE